MIRVYLVPPGRFRAPLAGTPDVEAASLRGLDEAMASRPHGLAPTEVAAVRRALEAVGAPRGPIAIAVASGGGVYRIEAGAPSDAAPRAPEVASPPSSWARHAGASVVLAHDDQDWNGRARDAVRFLGFDALAFGDVARPGESLATLVAERRPAAVLVGARAASAAGPDLVEAATRAPAALVLLSNGAPSEAPAGYAARVALPLRLAGLAPLIDRAIDAARGPA